GFFDEATFNKVVEHLPVHLRPVARFAYYCGWRKGEVVRLRWSQVDLKEKSIRLWSGETKNDQPRFLPLEGELLAIIQEQRRVVGSEHVFNRSGKPIGRFRQSWDLACRKAGCPEKLFHDLRRSASRNLRRAGLSESECMAITGHRTSSVFKRYSI